MLYTLGTILTSLNDNKVTISVLNLIILIASFIATAIASVLLYKTYNTHKTKSNTPYLDEIEDYYFSEYEKNITIYQNGNGIIIHRFSVIASDIDKLQKIRRKLNVEDGVKTLEFPTLNAMMQTNKSSRFKDFGFWYTSSNNIISEVNEFYWDSKSQNENKKAKDNPQEIRWIFNIDKDNVEKGVPYEICYVISVPGLAALENGYLNKELLNDPQEETSFSIMHIDHKIQKLKYTISFEEGIHIKVAPKCKCIISEQDSLKELDISGTVEYDLLYQKHIFNVEKPAFGSVINIAWKYNIT